MPKVNPLSTAFDAEGIVESVHAQEIGLRVTTNNPDYFKQIMYRAASKVGKKLCIFSYPQRPNSLALLKKQPTEETS